MVLFSLYLHSLAGHIPNQYCNILDPASNTCQNQQCLLLAAQHTAGGSGPHLLLRLLLGFALAVLAFGAASAEIVGHGARIDGAYL